MATNPLLLNFSDEEFSKAARKWQKEFLLMPLLAAKDSLKYMTGVPGVRYKTTLGSFETNAEFAPYKASRVSSATNEVIFRDLETFFGNVRVDFEPDKYIQTLLGESAAFLGDGQAQAPSAKLVIASVMKALGSKFVTSIFTAKRNENGNTTNDLFNGWLTILNEEIKNSSLKQEPLTLDAVTSANAVDLAKEMERSCDPILRQSEKFLFCDQHFADCYNDAYLLTHAGINYNKQYEQAYVEGSSNKTTIVPLPGLEGSKTFFVTPKSNILYGYDNMSDMERLEVGRYEPWFITLTAAMFFGCQFRTLDPRFIRVFKFQ